MSFSPPIVDRLVDALVIVDESGLVIYANPAFGALLGLDVRRLFGRPLTDFVPHRLREQYHADFVAWMRADPPPRSPGPTRIAMLDAQGLEVPVDVATFLVVPERGPRLVVAALWDRRLGIDVVRYQELADDLMAFLAEASGRPEEIVPQLLEVVATRLDFDFAAAWVWDEDSKVFRCEHRWSEPHPPDAFAAAIDVSVRTTFPMGEGLPGTVAESGQSHWVTDGGVLPDSGRADAFREAGLHTGFAFPISTKDHVVGVVELFSRTEREPDRALFEAVAEAAARLGSFVERLDLETERYELVVQLRRFRAQQEFLLQANLALVQANNFREAIHRLAEIAVPALGDLCLIDIVRGDGTFERLAARHSDPMLRDVTARLLAYPPEVDGSHPAALAVRTGRTQFSDDMNGPFMADTTQGREHLALTRALEFRSYVSVPLVVDDEAIGALTLVATDRERSFGDEELQLTQDLAGQVATVVKRTRSFDEQAAIARQLQESLLPRALPQIAGIDVAVRYEAIGSGAQVGGDFYDVVRLDAAAVALVVGDVEGHDTVAATVMGQLRSATRAFLTFERSPARVLDRLGGFLLGQEHSRMATMVVAVLDLSSGEITAATAGHPAPLVGGTGRSAKSLLSRPGPPLGVFGGQYQDERFRASPEDLLIFYTDGLIDLGRPGDDRRMDELEELLSAEPFPSCGVIADVIMARCSVNERHGDDVALLVARWTPGGEGGSAELPVLW